MGIWWGVRYALQSAWRSRRLAGAFSWLFSSQFMLARVLFVILQLWLRWLHSKSL